MTDKYAVICHVPWNPNDGRKQRPSVVASEKRDIVLFRIPNSNRAEGCPEIDPENVLRNSGDALLHTTPVKSTAAQLQLH
mmetsp:Transcript_45041/g.108638  ORF Transcript_45041/g.108638 Transcript_45041/m.108638 type:complete len:80 (+) Transcript_45041:2817-3056(+)